MILVTGPCAIEGVSWFVDWAGKLDELTSYYDIELYIKGSFDKANRTRKDSPRGVGMDRGLEALSIVSQDLMIPVCTDVHEVHQVEEVAEVVDIIQIPSFLGRQTDLLSAADASGVQVNLKRPQFSSSKDLLGMRTKAPEAWITFRGLSAGPHSPVVCDVVEMAETASIFDDSESLLDITHTNRGMIDNSYALAQCAKPCGFTGIYAEVHPDPSKAHCDAQNQMSFLQLQIALEMLL